MFSTITIQNNKNICYSNIGTTQQTTHFVFEIHDHNDDIRDTNIIFKKIDYVYNYKHKLHLNMILNFPQNTRFIICWHIFLNLIRIAITLHIATIMLTIIYTYNVKIVFNYKFANILFYEHCVENNDPFKRSSAVRVHFASIYFH